MQKSSTQNLQKCEAGAPKTAQRLSSLCQLLEIEMNTAASRTISPQGARTLEKRIPDLALFFSPRWWALLEKPGPANRGRSCSTAPSTASLYTAPTDHSQEQREPNATPALPQLHAAQRSRETRVGWLSPGGSGMSDSRR